MAFKRLFKWLTLVALLAIPAALLWGGGLDDLASVVGLLFFWGWIGGPLALPYVLSWGDKKETARIILFLFFTADSFFTAWVFFSIYTSESSTAPVGFIFAPLYSWGALLVVCIATSLTTGWVPSLSRDPTPRQSPPPG